jgi:hypothetical protein
MDFQEPLFDAVAKGDEDAVVTLLHMGASLTHGDVDGLTALHWASGSSDAENLVPVLIGQGAKLDIKDNFGRNPLHIHCQHGRANAVGNKVSFIFHEKQICFYALATILLQLAYCITAGTRTNLHQRESHLYKSLLHTNMVI